MDRPDPPWATPTAVCERCHQRIAIARGARLYPHKAPYEREWCVAPKYRPIKPHS